MNKNIGDLPILCSREDGQNGLRIFSTSARRADGTIVSFRGEGSEESRQQLEADLGSPVIWMNTGHTARIHEVGIDNDSEKADGYILNGRGTLLGLTSADCLPIVIYNLATERIAVVHAGWKGLSGGVIENAWARLVTNSFDANGYRAWIGPTIDKDEYEVGSDVLASLEGKPGFAASLFRPGRPGHGHLDLVGIARRKLELLGLESQSVELSNQTTFGDPSFHSARRDGQMAGRMATIAGFTRSGR